MRKDVIRSIIVLSFGNKKKSRGNVIYKAVVFMLLHASLWIENKTLPFAYKM